MRCVSLHFLQVYKNSSSGISGCFSGRPPNPIGTSPNKTPSLAASQTPFCVERHGFWLALSCASQVIFSDHRNPLPFQGTTFGNGKLILKRVLGREYVSARRGYVSNHSEFLVLYVFVCFGSFCSLTKLASTIIVNRCIHCWTFVNDSWIIDSWMQEPQCVYIYIYIYIYMDPIQIKTTRTSNLKILCLADTTTMRRWKPPKGTPLKSNMSPEKGPS